ncbi:vitellogenin 3, phosvitinless [Brienomyrus brachyistius]|uniref:vitellogenin 3, phosvitinless n=1 Tax=Brienomyrus brachyistius TaxID=42636 RepID=UPI0020B196ED|nr:vitellogenin 3, phosvitinless [Brienomyrus brachyistius]
MLVPDLNPKKTYEYKYVGVLTIGRDRPDLAESGVRIQCSLKITGVSDQTFLLQINDLTFDEFNGIPGKSSFVASPKLSQRVAAELTQPVMFEYVRGQVGDLQAPVEVSHSVLNIVRGILGFLQVTVKTTQNIYELEELGIHGLCQSNYAIEEDLNSKELHVTRIVDMKNCREKAAVYKGLALALENNDCKERGDNIVEIVKYKYNVRPTEDGGLITKVYAEENQLFSPFNVKGGNSKLLATKEVFLIGVTDSVGNVSASPMQNRGNQIYKFGTELNQIPLQLNKNTDLMAKISELIEHIVAANIKQVDNSTTADILQLYQLLRLVTLDNMETLWNKYLGNSEHRRWLLDVIAEVSDARVVRFLINRFQRGDLSVNEATQAVLLTFNHLEANSETVEMCKEFLIMPFSRSSDLLWSTVLLSYGSIVYRYCGTIDPCPVIAVQPLLDLATDSLSRSDEEDLIRSLKAIGNAGHLSSIKTIMKFLPGVSPTVVSVSTRVQRAAVQALRHLAVRDAHRVQEITLNLFMQKNLSSEVRMQACLILFDTKPPLALVSMIASFLLEESNLQVASFSYSLIRGLARSQTPDNRILSIACNAAVKILKPKLGHLSYHYSKALHFDWFNDDFLIGKSSDIYIFKNVNNYFPSTLISKWKGYFIGRILETIEFGVHTAGIQEMLRKTTSIFNEKQNTSLMEAILKMLSEWQSLPEKQPLISAFARVFGQEVFHTDLNKDVIQSVIQALSPKAGKESPIWNMIENIQNGIAWHWTKPYLIFETRYIRATMIGLPTEISKYYLSVTGSTVNAKSTISPPPTDNLGQLLDADIFFETDGNVRSAKDLFVFHGINTDVVQSGAELISTCLLNVPWKFSLKMNVKSMKFQLDTPPWKTRTEILSLNYNVYAVSRNIEDPAEAKMTPMVGDHMEFKENPQTFSNTTGESGQEQTKSWSEVDHLQTKICAKATIYATAMCMEMDVERAHYLSEYPLYYVLGYTRCAFTIEPVERNKPIDKIQIEINNGADKNTESISQSMKIFLSQQISKSLGSIPDPVLTMTALAVSGNDKPEGYETTVYLTQAAEKDEIQLLVSQIGEEANWRLCVDADVDRINNKSKMQLQWGAECQTYKMNVAAETSYLPGSNPSMNAMVNWEDVPEYMQEIGKRVGEYIPGVALLRRFSQIHEKNPEKQISALVTLATTESIHIRMEIPELTVYQKEIPLPFQFFPFESNQQNQGPSISSSVRLLEIQGICTISGNRFRTFNNIRFTEAVPKDCYLVLAKDCTTEQKFQVLVKEHFSGRKEVSLKTPVGSINMNYYRSGIQLKMNDSNILLSTLPIRDTSGQLLIKFEKGIVIEAPTLGLNSLYYNGHTIKVEIESGMKRTTCGLCGQADGETKAVFGNPKSQMARHAFSFLTSWILDRTDCSDTCSLQRQHLEMKRDMKSKCYSVEPVLRCREGCSPRGTVPQSVGFSCVPTDTAVTSFDPLSSRSYDTNSAYVEETVDAHISCSCKANDCLAA